ncbi:MAG: exonuclease SbcCD subunit D C-terminal domain-containing protein, partial [Syntrophomonadaceae bacterium]
SKMFDGTLEPMVMEDEIGPVNIYMLPFIKPAQVRRFYPEDPVESYQASVEAVLVHSGVDPADRNILIAHQFVTSAGKEPLRSESESVSVGGLDNVEASAFAAFDYVALGHLHAPQWIGRETIRYAGSPLKYSFSEARHTKSVTMVELGNKNQVRINTIPLEPLRDMREIKGPLQELISPSAYAGTNTEDYIHITLTDEEEIIDAIGKVHSVYPNVMRLEYDNQRTRSINTGLAAQEIHLMSPVQLFREFYQLQNNVEMDDEKLGIVTELLETLEGRLA